MPSCRCTCSCLSSAPGGRRQPSLSVFGFVVLAVAAGTASGLSINTGHELGHKTTKPERMLAQIALAVPAYGHFTAEPQRGTPRQRRDVRGPRECTHGRVDLSVRGTGDSGNPQGRVGAWKPERLKRTGRDVVSRHNRILQSWGADASAAGRPWCWPAAGSQHRFCCLHNAVAWWQLTSANYVEHYGLLRVADENGRPERCQPHHSWNSNPLAQQPGAVPPAAALGPPHAPAAPLPASATLRRPAVATLGVSRLLLDGLDATDLVPRYAPAAHGPQTRRRRSQQAQPRPTLSAAHEHRNFTISPPAGPFASPTGR